MAGEQWLSALKAVEIIRSRLGSSIGRAEATLRGALASGEVRFHPDPDLAVLLLPDDGIVGMDMRPGSPDIGNGKPAVRLSQNDLSDWLDRQAPQTSKPSAAASSGTRNKRGRAKIAVDALWPDKIPDQDVLLNNRLCKQVTDWLKSDYKKRGVPFTEISNDTILRAAGRKKE